MDRWFVTDGCAVRTSCRLSGGQGAVLPERQSPAADQWTKLTATAGATVAALLRPARITRAPARTPRLRFQLYVVGRFWNPCWSSPNPRDRPQVWLITTFPKA